MLATELKDFQKVLINTLTDLEISYGYRIEAINFNRQYLENKSDEGPVQLVKIEPTFNISIISDER